MKFGTRTQFLEISANNISRPFQTILLLEIFANEKQKSESIY
jgi:hypothetical protein